MIEDRPDPDELLRAVQQEEKKCNLGRLKIFFGMSAGVGKTYSMLEEAHQRLEEGVNLVVGVVNTHGREETEKILKGLPILPEKWIEFKDKAFKELDLEKILEIKPQLVLIDELAHTNVPGSKHPKRWQDVAEILDAGIDVYTTLNVQHLESRKDIVESITGITVHETVPDLILERATAIEIIDIPPTELLKRLQEGKVYIGDQSMIAAQNFFQEDHLTALREMALRFTAEKVDHDLHGILALGKGWKTRERLMVAISPAHSSQQLIRSARRLAFELDAPWVVVYVNTGQNLSTENQARLSKHLQLAAELGAEVITVNDLDIPSALQRIARQKNITRLVIGRPSKHSFFLNFFQKSLIDRLEEENKQMDILILREDRLLSVYKQAFPAFQFSSSLLSYGLAAGGVFLEILIGYFLLPLIGYQAVGLIFLVGILILSLFLGPGPVFFGAVLSALSWNFLFIPPYFESTGYNPNDIALIIAYFCVAILAGRLTNRKREQDLFAYRREEKIEHLYEIMREIAKSPNFQYLRLNVAAKLKTLFFGEFDIFIKGSDQQLVLENQVSVLNQETDRAAALWCFRTGKIAGKSTDTLPSAEALYFPILFAKKPLGVLMYYSKVGKTISNDEMSFLQTVAEQLGIYLERYVFEERLESQNYLRQVEKLHNAIFRSLSKGFYAPLNKIVTINQRFNQIAKTEEEKQISQDMDHASKNLKIIVDNILAISQLESGFVQYEKRKNSIKNLIEQSIQEVKSLINGHPLYTHLPQQDLFVDFDFNLMKIALKNLLLNAMEYSLSTKPININVQVDQIEFKLSVIDEGSGISQEMIPYIFEKFYRLPGSPMEGIGLGLTIVKAIVDIHQGKMEVQSREGQGTTFTLILPK
jgi:two-component system, OmpR family, sensor histidine kinase KdpD